MSGRSPADMGRREFFRFAGLGTSLAWMGRALRPSRPHWAEISGAAPAIPAVEYHAFPLSVVAQASSAFPRCIDASLVGLAGGSSLLAFSRQPEQGQEGLVASLCGQRLAADGRTAGAPFPLFRSANGTGSFEAPALRRLPAGGLGILFSRRQSARECQSYFAVSGDEGVSWSEPQLLAEGSYRSGSHDRLTVHSSGRLLAPLQCTENWDEHNFYVQVARSDDAGRTWALGNRIELPPVGGRLGCGWLESGCTAPGIAERSDGSLLMVIRTAMGTQFCSESSDRGITWAPPRSLEVGSPLAPAHLSRLPGRDELLLVWNPHYDPLADGCGECHTIMTAVSGDGGRSWPLARRKVLVHDPVNSTDSPTATHRGGEVWITVRRTGGPYALRGPASTALMRVPLGWLLA